MDDNVQKFIPERVDEQVDKLLARRHSAFPDKRVVDGLRHMYQDDERSLEKVWQRLGLANALPEDKERLPKLSVYPQPAGSRVLPFAGRHRMHQFREHSLTRTLSFIAAACMAVLLVGSLLLITNLARQNHSAGSGSTWQGTNPPQGIYVSSEQGLFRLDPLTQQVIWQQALKNEGIGQILPAGKVVYVSQHSKQQPVVAFDAQSGKILWTPALELPSAGDVGGLVLSNGRLYVQTAELTYVFNASNRKQLAVYPGGEDLAVGDGVLAMSNSTGLQIYNLSSNMGWHKQFDANTDVFSLSIVNHLLYAIVSSGKGDLVGQRQSYLIAYKVSTGEQVWKSPVFRSDELRSFSAEQDNVYFGTIVTDIKSGSWTGNVYAYNIQKNQLLWSKHVDGGIQSTPVIIAGTLYLTADGADNDHPARVIAIAKATGTITWQQTLTSHLADNFCVSNGVIYIANSSDSLYALNAVNGSKLWENTQIDAPTIVVPTA